MSVIREKNSIEVGKDSALLLEMLRARVSWLAVQAECLAARIGELRAAVDRCVGVSKVPAAKTLSAAARADGVVVVRFEDLAPFELTAATGALFIAMAGATGHFVDDGLVGFKSTADVLTQLSRHNRQVTRRALARLLSRLRAELERAMPGGEHLVEHHRRYGYRVRVQRSDGHLVWLPRG